MQVCFSHGGANPFNGAKARHMIELQQTGLDSFTVVYGLQVRTGLDYGQAAEELGKCLMHHQSCEGTIDNRTRAEARKGGDTRPVFSGSFGA